ncbi:hypothetical protein F7Q91_03045 [Vibrio chagasii]|uniref:Uncharacterized protein n=1 Tax=Vibrio chagasii TaxID=170679 RepID=A0A7V7NWV6_9VIBR|nr:hypothetical protein [Vibrio chagasii]KAB0482398.1 hypothetical protein F7Q91_03045 [Vibrio chagasii]
MIRILTEKLKMFMPKSERSACKHDLIRENYLAINRSPYYSLVLAVLSILAAIFALNTFIKSMGIIATKNYIASTTSDTAVQMLKVTSHILPKPNQELHPGETLSEEESEKAIRKYLVESLRDCFSMNYLNSAEVISKCKANHLDSETDTQDRFYELLDKSNYLKILKKYETSASVNIDEDSITLENYGLAGRQITDNFIWKRAIWIFRLNMNYEMKKVNVTSPTVWEVEMIREQTFNKEFPVSIFKIRDVR